MAADCQSCQKCTCDHSSDADQGANLLALDVVESIFSAATVNMTKRAVRVADGTMTHADYEAAKDHLAAWLQSTFSGENPHFVSDRDWHEKGGLADLLRARFNLGRCRDDQALSQAIGYFIEDADGVARRLALHGGMASPQASLPVMELSTLWSELFTGSPQAMASR